MAISRDFRTADRFGRLLGIFVLPTVSGDCHALLRKARNDRAINWNPKGAFVMKKIIGLVPELFAFFKETL